MLYRKINHTFVRTTSVNFVHTFVCFATPPRAFFPHLCLSRHTLLPRLVSHILRAPGDEERLALAFSDRWAISTSRRLKGKGLPFWLDFLASRGFVEGVSHMSPFLDDAGICERDRLHLASLYALHLKDKGLVPRDYFTLEWLSAYACRNLPPGQFTTKSFKIGGITSLKTLGDSQSLLLSKMDHKSAASSAHYQRSQLCHRPGPPLLSSDQGPLAGGQLGYSTETYKIDLAFTAGLSSSSSSSSNLHPCKRVKSCPL
jgi:hypothetical protein